MRKGTGNPEGLTGRIGWMVLFLFLGGCGGGGGGGSVPPATNTTATSQSVSINLSTDAILADGSDASTMTVAVSPADQFADGSVIDLQLVSGQAALSATSVQTLNGQAQVTVTAQQAGNNEVQVSVPGTSLTATATIRAVSDFADVFTKTPTGQVNLLPDKITIQAGSTIGLTITNTVQRTFTVQKASLLNGGGVVSSTTDPLLLNGGSVSKGEKVGLIFQTSNDLQNNGLVFEYLLTDPITGHQFSVAYSYTIPAN